MGSCDISDPQQDLYCDSDVSGQQVTPIPHIHRSELLPSPPTSSWSNISFMSLALFVPQNFSLSQWPLFSHLYSLSQRLQNRIFPHHLHTNQLLKLPIIAMPFPPPTASWCPEEHFRLFARQLFRFSILKIQSKMSPSGKEAL